MFARGNIHQEEGPQDWSLLGQLSAKGTSSGWCVPEEKVIPLGIQRPITEGELNWEVTEHMLEKHSVRHTEVRIWVAAVQDSLDIVSRLVDSQEAWFFKEF